MRCRPFASGCGTSICATDRACIGQPLSDELRGALTDIAQYDFLVMGRTPRAWATHPPVQNMTEALTNLVFAKIYGEELDITAGSRGLSRKTARLLSLHSREETVGVDGEWPILLKQLSGLQSGYRAYDGLEFESRMTGI